MIEDFTDSKKENNLKETVFYGSHGFLKRFGYEIVDLKDQGKIQAEPHKKIILELSKKSIREKYKEILINDIKHFIFSVKDYFSEISEGE